MERDWLGGRTWRLCRKELRETLRDRRTIVTLLLMPILVYPLLSMVMQRLLLASASKKNTSYIVAVESVQDGNVFLDLVKQSQSLLQLRPYQPIRVHRLNERPNSDGTDEPKIVGSDGDVPQFDIRVVEGDVSTLLRDGVIDLAISVRPVEEEPNAVIQPFRFRVLYRQGDPTSERAVARLQQMMQLINDVTLTNRSKARNREYRGAIEMLADPIRTASDGPGGLVTVIPLVLLLMTITGAVYPAIDLTAGERERGTMESLIASPVPRYLLLLSKYVAVVTVAVLTAVANLSAMWVTLTVTGVGQAVFGKDGLTLLTMLQIFPLLLVFACFFSAILLALCSFAKSFKEAQAYLIPVMLISLAPGLFSLMPGVKFTPSLAIVPLVNMVLLSRDILTQSAEVVPAFSAIVSTLVYAAATLSIAAKLFGADATHHGGQGRWSDLWTRPDRMSDFPVIGQLCTFLAMFYPIYFVATNLLAQVASFDLSQRLWINALVTMFLFLALPLLFAWYRKIRLKSTFRLGWGESNTLLVLIGVGCLGASLWMVAHETFIVSLQLQLSSLSDEQIALAKKAKEELVQLPLWMVLMTSAILPAIAEEFFFRGFVISSLSRISLRRQILLSGILFGAFHVISGNSLAIERFLPTTILGIALGAMAVQTRSLWPGILLHALHNGLMFSLAFYQEALVERGWGVAEEQHLPWTWLVTGGLLLASGTTAIVLSRRRKD